MPGGPNRRGGSRTGSPGVAYPQRTDLNAGKVLPITAPTGLPYGEHKALVDTQRQVPIAAAPPAPVPGGAGATPLPATPAPLAPAPGSFPPLDRPTERPHEPITAGAPVGAGPGPEAVGQLPATLSSVIAQAAQASGSTDLQFLAEQAQRFGQ